MKSKITISIDSELLNFIRQDHPNTDIDSLIQDSLAKFLGIRQVWIKIDNTEQEKTQIQSPVEEITKEINAPKDIIPKKQRNPKHILKIWEKVKSNLNDEFTIDDYWDIVKKSGFQYKDGARTSTIIGHLHLLEIAGKIIKIGEKPLRYRKEEDIQKSENSQNQETINGERLAEEIKV